MKQILFIDDEIDHLSDHIKALKDVGYAVVTQRTTDAALKQIVKPELDRFSLVVLDMMMPSPEEDPDDLVEPWEPLKSGSHLLLRIRRVAVGVPVLLVSNLDETDIQHEAWSCYERWCHDNGKDVSAAASDAQVRDVLKRDFRTWYRAKRRIPPWDLPRVVGQILGA